MTGIRYANCWEDADVLCEALEPSVGRRLLSIGSGGDNSFALAAGGAEVVVADLSRAQLACIELKRTALERLEYSDVLDFLGLRPSGRRRELYRSAIQDRLPSWARTFWEDRIRVVDRGVIHCGKLERAFFWFRRGAMPLIHRRRTIDLLLQERSAEEQRRFYDEIWDTARWRALLRVLSSRLFMLHVARDPGSSRRLEGSMAHLIRERFRHGLGAMPTHTNPFLRYMFSGTSLPALPRYLQPDRFEQTRDGLGRITLFHGSVCDAARQHGGGGFDGFNLSDIFEYQPPAHHAAQYRLLVGHARPAARLAYWNMMVPRRIPVGLAERVCHLDHLSASLRCRDKSFFYTDFRVDEVA